MLSTDSQPRARLAAALFLVLGLSLPLSAEQSASDKLREQAKQLQTDIELLKKSKAELSAAASKALLDTFDKEIESKKTLLAKVDEQAREAESLEADIQKLSPVEEQLGGRSSAEFLVSLHREIERRKLRLGELAATPSTSSGGESGTAVTPANRAPEEPGPAEGSEGNTAATLPAAKSASPTKPTLNPVEVPPAVITGRVEKNSTVHVMDDGKLIGTTVANGKGDFKLETGRLRSGDKLRAVQANPRAVSEPVNVTTAKDCDNDPRRYDCRPTFEASFYTGYAIDTFAAEELIKFQNQDQGGPLKERWVGGFDFAYRLYGKTAKGDLANSRKPQVWIYGETVHGVRSTDVTCTKDSKLPLCKSLSPTSASEQFSAILRKATSLEAFTGLRVEFHTLNAGRDSPANLYWKSEYGFLDVADSGGKTFRESKWGALGLEATKGRYQGSYFEAGYGRSQLLAGKSKGRLKIDAFLTWEMFHKKVAKYVRPYAQMTVDKSLGRGSDSIQTFIGFDFDLCNLMWHATGCVTEESGK